MWWWRGQMIRGGGLAETGKRERKEKNDPVGNKKD